MKAIDSLQPSIVISELDKYGLSREGFESVLKDRLFRFRVLAIDANAPYKWDEAIDVRPEDQIHPLKAFV